MNEFHFLRPLWLAALPLVPLAVWYYAHRRSAGGRWREVVDAALAPFVLTGAAEGRAARGLSWFFGLVVALLIVALAGPAMERLPQPVYRDEAALVIALDLSRSMNARDVLPTRLERARLKVRDLLEQRVEGETALLVFAGDAFTVSPLTDDSATIVSLLASLTTDIMPRQGSRLAPALARADRLLTQAGAANGRVLLVTDGVSDEGAAVRAAKALAAKGVQISVLGVATPEGEVVRTSDGELVKDASGQIVVARLQRASLAAVSAAGNGRFSTLKADDTDLDVLLAAGEEVLPSGTLRPDLQTDVWREEGPWIVLLCLPFLALLFRRGWIACVVFMVSLPAPPADAGAWTDLWQRRDQQAAKEFAGENYARAAELFKDSEWQAAAAFRAGDYQRSAAALAGLDHADAHYNRGNALALAGRMDEARAAYESALAREPDYEDARHNLDLLNQNQQQQSQNQDSDQQGQEQNPGDNGEQNQQQQGRSEQSEQDSSGGDDRQTGEEEPSDDETRGDEQQQADAEDSEGQDESEPQDAEGEQRQAESDAEQERDLAAEQWLRQVPDDPGGLLRRKFLRQYRQRSGGRPAEDQEW